MSKGHLFTSNCVLACLVGRSTGGGGGRGGGGGG